MTRPERRTETFSFKMTAEEKRMLDAAATQVAMKPGALVYQWVQERLLPTALPHPPALSGALPVALVDRTMLIKATALIIAALSNTIEEATALTIAQTVLGEQTTGDLSC